MKNILLFFVLSFFLLLDVLPLHAGKIPPPDLCGLLLGQRDGEMKFVNVIKYDEPRFLADHVINGVPVFAAAASIDNLALAAMIAHQKPVVSFKNLKAPSPLQLCKSGACVSLTTSVALEKGGETSVSFLRDGEQTKFFYGKFSGASDKIADVASQPKLWLPKDVSKNLQGTEQEIYRYMDNLGLEYGPQFRRIMSFVVNENLAQGHLAVDPKVDYSKFATYPGLVDALFQLGAAVRIKNGLTDQKAFIPGKIGEIHIANMDVLTEKDRYLTGEVEVTAGLSDDATGMRINATLFNGDIPVVVVRDFFLTAVAKERMSR